MTADLEFHRNDDDEQGLTTLMPGTSTGRKWIFANVHLESPCFPIWIESPSCASAITAAARDDGLNVSVNGVEVEAVE
jgi:hypothetical protein